MSTDVISRIVLGLMLFIVAAPLGWDVVRSFITTMRDVRTIRESSRAAMHHAKMKGVKTRGRDGS
jgi:hypothetical protein